MIARRIGFAAMTAVLLSLAAVPAVEAAEVPNHAFIGEVGEFVVRPGSPPDREAFEDPCGLAFDADGNLYVSNYYRDQVDVLEPSGASMVTRLLNEEPVDGPCALAVGPTGALFVDNYHRNVLEYAPVEFPLQYTEPYRPLYGAGAQVDSEHSTGLVIDPADGDLYVDDRTYVALYEAPVHPGETPVRLEFDGAIEDGYGIAISDHGTTAGDIYIADAATDTVKIFNRAEPAGPVGELDGAGTPQGGFESLRDAALAVDQSDGHLFVVDDLQDDDFTSPEAAVDEFNAEGIYRGQVGRWTESPEAGVKLEHHLVDSEPSGVAIGPDGDLYVTSGNGEGGAIDVFGPTGQGKILTVTKSGSGSGVVSSSPGGIDCGPACTAEENAGAEVILTATPAAGSVFTGWSGECTGTGTCVVAMGAARSVGAQFEVTPVPLAEPHDPSGGGAGTEGAALAAGLAAPAGAGSTGEAHAGGQSGLRRHRHSHHRHRGGRGRR